MKVRATLTTATLRRLERLLIIVLTIAVLDTAYLSWRYIALHANLVSPGTGICSWTASVDCDQVLLTPQARAFYVPNAVLGFGFYFGCLIWWVGGRGLGVAYRRHVIRTLAVWLAVATLFTLRFFWLLIHLKAFCPFCPWNHLLTYLALAVALLIWRAAPRPTAAIPRKPLIALASLCVAQFWVWQVTWIIAHWRGLM
jgi:uncharacterized membrane protein